MEILLYAGAAVVGYLLGAFPTGYVVAWLWKGIDPRRHGSGRTGGTNILRSAGREAALVTIVGDFGKGYIWADKGGFKQDMSIHVRFIYDETCFRFVYRADGQPVMAKALTPYKGTNTLGYFVKLATRS